MLSKIQKIDWNLLETWLNRTIFTILSLFLPIPKVCYIIFRPHYFFKPKLYAIFDEQKLYRMAIYINENEKNCLG